MKVILLVSITLILKQVLSGITEILIAASDLAKIHQQCKPFGVRVNWGRSVYDQFSCEKVGIRFNTNKKCQNVELLLNDKTVVHCPIRKTSNFTMANGDPFTSFIHQCSFTSQIDYDTPFKYNIIDVGLMKNYFLNDIEINIKNPKNINRVAKFIHFADWGYQKYLSNERPNITKPMNQIINTRQIDAVIINGDLAYDINSNLTHHLNFMGMLQQTSKIVPMIFNRGNHEFDQAALFFCQYFQVYDLCQKNSTGLSIGSAYLSLFDPQAALIPRRFKLYKEEQRLSSLINLKKDLKKGNSSKKNIIALSHYPLLCSYPSSDHCLPNQKFNQILPLYINLQEHFNTLLDYGVPLYLAGHVHTYQRSLGIKKGYKYISSKNNKKWAKKEGEESFIVQIIDGVAGSDTDLYESYTIDGVEHKPSPFVAAYNLNRVGFGIVTSQPSKISYEHLGVNLDGSYESVDQVQITVQGKIIPISTNQIIRKL